MCVIQIITIDDSRSRARQFSAWRRSSVRSSQPGGNHTSWSLLYPCQRLLHLREPEGHVNGAVEVASSGESQASLLYTAHLVIQCPEPHVAMRLQRAHANLLSQGEGLAVVGFGQRALRRRAPQRDLTEEAQGIRLIAPFLLRTGERQRTFGEGLRLLQTASHQLRFPQGETTERLKTRSCCGNGLFQYLREQWHGVGDAPRQRVRRPQGWRHLGEPGPGLEVHLLTEVHRPFKQGQGPGQVTLTKGE